MKTYTVADITDDRPLADKEALVAEWNAFETGRAMRDWTEDMQRSDRLMTRHTEDIIDKLTTIGFPRAVVDAYNAKKALRAKKPT